MYFFLWRAVCVYIIFMSCGISQILYYYYLVTCGRMGDFFMGFFMGVFWGLVFGDFGEKLRKELWFS